MTTHTGGDMKTYEEYLKIIKDREFEKDRPFREAREKLHEEHKSNPNVMCFCFAIDGTKGKMTFDYSVEIMGMMMQDFLEELQTYPIQFDSKGRIKVVVDTLDTTSKEKGGKSK